jgi:hypothetical protein
MNPALDFYMRELGASTEIGEYRRPSQRLWLATMTVLDGFSKNTRYVLRHRTYAGGGCQQKWKLMTLSAIGEKIGVCKERVRDINLNATRKLEAAIFTSIPSTANAPDIGWLIQTPIVVEYLVRHQ